MKKRLRAKPGDKVSTLGLGTMETRRLGGAEANSLLNQVLDISL